MNQLQEEELQKPSQKQHLHLSEDEYVYDKEGASMRRSIFTQKAHSQPSNLMLNTYIDKNNQKDEDAIEFETDAYITQINYSIQTKAPEEERNYCQYDVDQDQAKVSLVIEQQKNLLFSNITQQNNTNNTLIDETWKQFKQINSSLNNNLDTSNVKENTHHENLEEIKNKERSLSASCYHQNHQNQRSKRLTKQFSKSFYTKHQQQQSKQSAYLCTQIKPEGADTYWRFLGIMKKVKKYAHILSDIKYYRDIRNLRLINFRAINDKSYFLSSEINFSIKNLLKNFEVIEPNSTKAVIWNTILLLVLFFLNIFVPLKISMNMDIDEDTPLYYLFYVFPSAVLLFDILIHFNIAYYDKGILVVNHQSIFHNYLKLDFFVNSITTMSLILSLNINLIESVLIIRLLQIPSLISRIDEHFQLQQRFNTFFQLTKLLLLIFYCAHIVGCGFHYLARLQMLYNYDDTWLARYNLTNESIQIRYLHSIYFAFITMVTVGYGDITPQSPVEKIYTIVVTIFSCGMFGYSMNTIGAIFQEIAKQEAEFKQIKYDMTQYMRSRGISNNLQIKVLKNLEYSNALKGNQVKRGEEIMESLTSTLRNQIKKEFYGGILSAYKLFNLNFSQEARNEICQTMKEIIVQPGETIFEQGNTHDRIYFLYRGKMEISVMNHNNSPVVIGKATVGSMLGQNGFFCKIPENFSAKSIDASYLLYCDRLSFLDSIQKYQKDFELFYKLRDNLTVFNREWNTQCFSCNKLGHQTHNCCFYNLNLLKLMVISRHELPIFQQRDSSRLIRKEKKQFQSLSQRQQIMTKARKLRLDLFYEAYEGNDLEISDGELELLQDDMEFLILIPAVRYEGENLVYSHYDLSDFSEEDISRRQQENFQFTKKPSFINQELIKGFRKNRKNIFEYSNAEIQEIQKIYNEIIKSENESNSDSEKSSIVYSDDQGRVQGYMRDSNESKSNSQSNEQEKNKEHQFYKTSSIVYECDSMNENLKKNRSFSTPSAEYQILKDFKNHHDTSQDSKMIKQFLAPTTKSKRSSHQSLLQRQSIDNWELYSQIQQMMNTASQPGSLRKFSIQNSRMFNQISDTNIQAGEEFVSNTGYLQSNATQNINSSVPSLKAKRLQVVREIDSEEDNQCFYIPKQQPNSQNKGSSQLLGLYPSKGSVGLGQHSFQSQLFPVNQSTKHCQSFLEDTELNGNKDQKRNSQIQNVEPQQYSVQIIKNYNNQSSQLQKQTSLTAKFEKTQRDNNINQTAYSHHSIKDLPSHTCLQNNNKKSISSAKQIFPKSNRFFETTSNRRGSSKQQIRNEDQASFNSRFVKYYNTLNCKFQIEFIIPYFDKFKEYQGYYPHNNLSNVMKQCKEIYFKLVRQRIKTRGNKKNQNLKQKITQYFTNNN